MEIWLLAAAACPATVDGLHGSSAWSRCAGLDDWLALLGAEESETSGFDMSMDPSTRGLL